jgi:hypothetical protein
MICDGWTPARSAALGALLQPRPHVGGDVLVVGELIHGLAVAAAVHQNNRTLGLSHHREEVGSRRPPLTSFTQFAPASRAADATGAKNVSTEISASGH